MHETSPAKHLPHRRQRPLVDNSFEYHVFEHANDHSPDKKLRSSVRLMSAVMGLIAGLATVGMGATVMPFNSISSNPEVAGIQTTEAFNPEIVDNNQGDLPNVCWNQVEVSDEGFFWPDSCRGLAPQLYHNCIEKPQKLVATEELAYRVWWSLDKVLPQDCNASPEEIPKELPTRNPFQ